MANRFNFRTSEEELMDDLSADGPVISQTLRELETINRWLGGNFVTIDGIVKLIRRKEPKKLKIADLGCGGGDMLKLVAQWAKKKDLEVELIGFDANPHIVKYAEENCQDFDNISFEEQDIFSEAFKEREFDIILCTLFTHHFSCPSLVEIFQQFKRQSKYGVVINDLHRHPLAYHSIKLLVNSFSKSEMVKNDGPLSVLRSFKRKDLIQIMNQAEVQKYSLKWMWAFRWQLVF